MREKKAAEFTLHCDMQLYRKLSIARLAQKNAAFRLESGTNFTGSPRVMFYVCLGGRISLSTHAHAAFADNSLFFCILSPCPLSAVCAAFSFLRRLLADTCGQDTTRCHC